MTNRSTHPTSEQKERALFSLYEAAYEAYRARQLEAQIDDLLSEDNLTTQVTPAPQDEKSDRSKPE